MAEVQQCYEIPVLELDEMLACFHEGVLGQRAANITAEHLKTPTPASMMQVCLSILEKVEVEVDTLCHPRLQSSLELRHPDTYMNTFKVVHVAMLMRKVLPTYGSIEFQLTDLTSPRWKRVRKFLCAAINYCKSWDMNMPAWEKIYSKTAESAAEHQKLSEEVAACEQEIRELEAYSAKHESRRIELKEKKEQINKKLEECHKLKEEKVLIKETLKKNFSDMATAVDKKAKHIEALNAEKDKLLKQVVGSPKRYMTEKQMLHKKMKMVQELNADWQGKIHEAERKNATLLSMEQLLSDVEQTLKDNKIMSENMTKMDSEKQAQMREIENRRLVMVSNTQEATNLKEQSRSLREKMARMSVRCKQSNTEFQSLMDALTREKEVLESEAGHVHLGVKKKETEIKTLLSQQEEVAQRHKAEMDEMKEKQVKIMQVMVDYHKIMMDRLHNSDVALMLKNEEKAGHI